MVRRESFETDEEGLLHPPSGMTPTAEKAAILQMALAQSGDIEGLIAPDLLLPEKGEVSSARSQRLMERVALVFADPDDSSTITEKLTRAGCPPELYFQMREMPEFKSCLHKAVNDYIVLPRIGAMMKAMSNAAMLGDTRAAGRCIEFAQLINSASLDDMADDLSRIQDSDAYAREVMQTLKDVQKLVADLGIKDEQIARQQAAAGEVKKVKHYTRKQKINHKTMHGPAGGSFATLEAAEPPVESADEPGAL